MITPNSMKTRRPANRRVPHIRPFSLLALGPILISCSGPLPPAVGSANEIGVIGNLSSGDPRIEILKGRFELAVPALWEERSFRLDPMPAGARRCWKAHIVLVDLTNRSDRRLTRSLLDGEEREAWMTRPAEHALFRDVWAAGQVVLLLHARDAASLQDHLDRQGAGIYEEFGVLLLEALRDGLFAGGEELELERRIRMEHGFGLRIPVGFALEGAEGIVQIKRIVPEEPKRWLVVHHGPAEEAPRASEEWLDLRDSVLARLRDGDRVLRSLSEVREGRFQGNACRLIEGIWQNETYFMGGPFRSYGFVREGRYFLIDLTVYHPPAPKLPALRQLEAIARTFET